MFLCNYTDNEIKTRHGPFGLCGFRIKNVEVYAKHLTKLATFCIKHDKPAASERVDKMNLQVVETS